MKVSKELVLKKFIPIVYFIRQGVVEIVLKEFNNFPFMIIEKGICLKSLNFKTP